MPHQFSRRSFHRSALAAAVAAGTAPAFLRGQNLNSKLSIAVIGCGGRGAANMGAVSSENIVALCDVNARNLDAASSRHPQAKKFVDFRQLFENPQLFDACTVSTTEHTHAFATMLALKNGKHVYCEKPLTHDVWEARQIRLAAEKARVATQMGIQIHANENYIRVVELIQAGVIGPVHEVHVWVSRAWGLQSEEAAKRNKDIVYVTERPKDTPPVPEYLNWDLWIGPAPYRPFNPVYIPGSHWYRWWDFGNGTMSDLGSHYNDLPFWALGLQSPVTIESKGPPPHPEIAPASMSASYEYAARGNQPPVRLTWHQGEDKPEIWTAKEIPQWADGVLFIGKDGMLLSNYTKHTLLPENKFADLKQPPETLPRPKEHHAEWIAAAKAGKRSSANFTYSGWLTEANHLGNVAFRTGKKLQWNPDTMAAPNAPESAPFIQRSYRPGWSLV